MPEERNTDTALLQMEWPDPEQYEPLAAYNDRTGRGLGAADYERLRALTNAPDPKPRTSPKDTMAGVSCLLAGPRKGSDEWSDIPTAQWRSR